MTSWAEQYEARKAERLKKEGKMKLNKNLGFGNSDSSSESEEDVKVTVELKNEIVEDTDEFTDQVGKLDEENVVGTLKDSHWTKSKTETNIVLSKDEKDPWFSTYEAKKAAAMENLKSGKLQSVAGASGFVGKIEGVEHFSKNNEVTKLMHRFKQEEPKTTTVVNSENSEMRYDEVSDTSLKKPDLKSDPKPSRPALYQPRFMSNEPSSSSSSTVTAPSPGPPPTPRQLLQLTMPSSPSSPPSDRPSRPSVPTPGKYGTLYGGAPSPGPNPSRSFQPPGFVPPTPPANLAKKRAWPGSFACNNQEKVVEEKNASIQSLVRMAKADSKLSTSSWQEEYLARKKARLGNS